MPCIGWYWLVLTLLENTMTDLKASCKPCGTHMALYRKDLWAIVLKDEIINGLWSSWWAERKANVLFYL